MKVTYSDSLRFSAYSDARLNKIEKFCEKITIGRKSDIVFYGKNWPNSIVNREKIQSIKSGGLLLFVRIFYRSE